MSGQQPVGTDKVESKEPLEKEPAWAPPEGQFSLIAILRLISFAWVTPMVAKVSGKRFYSQIYGRH
jgi:hypothetical protein